MIIKQIACATFIAAGALAVAGCGPSAFSRQMMAICTESRSGNAGFGGRDCTCAVNALDSALTSDEKAIMLAAAIAADPRQSPAAREQANESLRQSGFMGVEEQGSPAAAYAEKMRDLGQQIRRNCPRS